MRMQGRYWLVLSLGAAVALVGAACDGGMIPVAPSAGAAATNMSVASQPAPATNISFAAGASKVDVCHVEGNGSFHLINVSDNALPAHLAHGDAQPGDLVPGVSGKKFDQDCNQVDAASCPCWDAADLARFISPPVTCNATHLPSQFVMDSSNPNIRWVLDGGSRCSAKGAISIPPVTVTPQEFAACLALLQPFCSVR